MGWAIYHNDIVVRFNLVDGKTKALEEHWLAALIQGAGRLMFKLSQNQSGCSEVKIGEVGFSNNLMHWDGVIIANCVINVPAALELCLRSVAKHGGQTALRVDINRKDPIATKGKPLC